MEVSKITIVRAQTGPNQGKMEASITMEGTTAYPDGITMPIPDELVTPIVSLIEQAVAAAP